MMTGVDINWSRALDNVKFLFDEICFKQIPQRDNSLFGSCLRTGYFHMRLARYLKIV